MSFLPINKKDMEERGWEQLDFLYISGDAYVDHPSFGHAVITRVLENEGYKVGIIAQPNWLTNDDFIVMGAPKCAVLISSGVIDSMVNHYTASKRLRSSDEYSPDGRTGHRPDRAVIVYSNKIREIFGNIPIIIGGIEASLRRFAHYDFWQDKVRRSILQDSRADLLIYGMGEKPIVEIAKMLSEGIPINKIKGVRGTSYLANFENLPNVLKEALEDGENQNDNISNLNSYEEVSGDKRKYAKTFKIQYDEQDAITGKTLVQQHGNRFVVQNPPVYPLSEKEMDRIYSLPFERTYHPIYEEFGGIPAIKEVEFSIVSHRGCFGGCAFCALNFHQGRVIQRRSQNSILAEANKLVWQPGFKGYIHDVGGPTANFRSVACKKQIEKGVCKDRQCLYPKPCKNLIVDHSEYLDLLKKVRNIPEIKKVFIRSGIRYDYLILDKNDTFFNELCEHHVSGQLKVAPEHISDNVLNKMGKPGKDVYNKFVEKYYKINKRLGKEQYLVPYLISGHPGSDLNGAIDMAVYLKNLGYSPEQVQQFYPTPGTLSTCMYYTGIDPRNMSNVYVARTPKEKAMQRALLQFKKPENHKLVLQALITANRTELIGFGKQHLIPPRVIKGANKRNEMRSNEGKSKVKKDVKQKKELKSNGKRTKKFDKKKRIK